MLTHLRHLLWGVPVAVTVNDCFYGPVAVASWRTRPYLDGLPGTGKDVLLIERWRGVLAKYRRGDVVLLKSPHLPRESLVGRLVALEGDWLAVPGTAAVEKIPQGHCWVEGPSELSGAVPAALIQGRAALSYRFPAKLSVMKSELASSRLLVRNDRAFRRKRPGLATMLREVER